MKNKLMGNDLWIFITKSGLTLSVNILKLDFAQNSFWPPPPSHLFARFECPPGKHFPHLSPNKSLHMKVKPETPVPPPSLVGTSVRKCVWCVCVWVFVRESVYMCECVCVYVCVCVFMYVWVCVSSANSSVRLSFWCLISRSEVPISSTYTIQQK